MSLPSLAIILLVGIGYRLYGRFVTLVKHCARSMAEIVRQGPYRV